MLRSEDKSWNLYIKTECWCIGLLQVNSSIRFGHLGCHWKGLGPEDIGTMMVINGGPSSSLWYFVIYGFTVQPNWTKLVPSEYMLWKIWVHAHGGHPHSLRPCWTRIVANVISRRLAVERNIINEDCWTTEFSSELSILNATKQQKQCHYQTISNQ